MSRPLVLLLAAACGLSVANIYYNQPLLADFQREFGATAREVGWIPTATQVGYALAMLFIVPLGDMLERRRLIVVFTFVSAAMLGLCAISTSLASLVTASLLVGVATATPQLILPLAAHLAPDERRGQVIGTIMGGLLIGILLARTVSGFVGARFGWRVMFTVAALAMVLLAAALRIALPKNHSEFHGHYGSLLASLGQLVRDEPVLRQSALIGALLFASFSVFWATLVFHLVGEPFRLGAEAAGLFGLLGAAGAGAAPLVGRLADRRDPLFAIRVGLAIVILSYLVFWIFGETIAGLVAGVLLLDVGVQSAHIANQTRVFGLIPSARSRLNTIYMFCYFMGGAFGSAVGVWAWQAYGWPGVSASGLAFSCAAALRAAQTKFRKSKR